MSGFNEELQTLVESIIEPLIDNPDALRVESVIDGNEVSINIEVDPEDAGKVIGRQGRVIKSVRTLVRAAASRKDMSANVELID